MGYKYEQQQVQIRASQNTLREKRRFRDYKIDRILDAPERAEEI